MNPEAHLPLSAPMFAVLLTLGREAMHPYGVIQAFEARTGQEGVLLPGSLYNTISRMLRTGLLEEVARPEGDEDARRRYYRATKLGRAVCEAESRRLRSWLALSDRGLVEGLPE